MQKSCFEIDSDRTIKSMFFYVAIDDFVSRCLQNVKNNKPNYYKVKIAFHWLKMRFH